MRKPGLDPNEPDHPTDEQMTAMSNALRKSGKGRLLEALQATRSDSEKKKPEQK
jgi:hypothetical protein